MERSSVAPQLIDTDYDSLKGFSVDVLLSFCLFVFNYDMKCVVQAEMDVERSGEGGTEASENGLRNMDNPGHCEHFKPLELGQVGNPKAIPYSDTCGTASPNGSGPEHE